MFTSVLAPLARAIKALEATNTTAGDVFLFWIALAASLDNLLSKPEDVTGISTTLASKVRGIINKRYSSFIDEAPSDVYFNAFYLDPRTSLCLETTRSECAYSPH